MSDDELPKLPTSLSSKVLKILGSVALAPVLVLAFTGAPSCMGFDEPTLRALEACPQSAAMLGTPVSESWLGLSCGNARTSNDHGRASWMFPVAGPRGSGSVEVQARMQNGTWSIQRGVLTTSQGSVDFVSCTTTGPLGIQRQGRRATVESVIGSPGVAVGDVCSVEVSPTEEVQNCRIEVRCGATALYGATPETGWVTCGVDATGGVTARDADPTSAGGDPTFDLRLGEHTVVLTDQTSAGTWVVSLRVE